MRSEASIERACVTWAKERGILSIKLTTSGPRGSAGWPDRLFFKNGLTVYVEFKRPGCVPTALQLHRHSILLGEGFSVYVIGDVEEFKDIMVIEFSGKAL